MVVVVTVVVVMAVATPQAVMVVDTGVAVAMAVDTSGVVTSADVILLAATTALLISVRATSVETTDLRAGTSSVEIVSTTTRSATDTDGIILPGSARLAGAAGVAAGVAGGLGRTGVLAVSFRRRFVLRVLAVQVLLPVLVLRHLLRL